MKRRIMVLLTALMILLCGAAVSAHAEEYTVRLTIADGTEVPEEGLSVDVREVMEAPQVAGGGFMSSYAYVYSGYATNVYYDTSWIKRNHTLPHGYSWQSVSFAPGERSAEVTFEGDYAPRMLAYQIDSNGCIGSGGDKYISFDNEEIPELEISYTKSVQIKGTVTIPESYGDCTYKVTAIGDTYKADEPYTFQTVGTLTDGETSDEYSLSVADGGNYTVYVTFDDVYKMQETSVTAAGEDIPLDFTGEKADKITGTIKLPDDFTEFVTEDGDTLDDVQVEITMQDASGDGDESHKLVKSVGASLTPDKRSAEFEIYNLSEAENVIIYYEIIYSTPADGLYIGGAYADDTKCSASVADAAVMKPSGQNITINMLVSHKDRFTVYDKAKVHTLDGAYYWITAYVRDGKGGWYEVPVETEYKLFCAVTLPGDCHEYVPAIERYNDIGDTFYYGKKGFVRNIEDADIVNDEMTPDINWTGFDPSLPLECTVSENYDEENGEHTFYLDIRNNSDFDINNFTIYTVRYDENGLPISMTDDSPRRFLAGTNMHIEKYFTDANYNGADKIRVFIWDNNNRALCGGIGLK